MADVVGPDELAQCLSVLRRLQPADAEAHADLHAEGKRLWRRSVIKERFGESDVVAFMEQEVKHKELLTKWSHERAQGISLKTSLKKV